MKILSVETSCDETSAAVVERSESDQFIKVLSNITATSLAIHATTGGIIPENAAREQVKFIMPVIVKALNESRSTNHESWEEAYNSLKNDIDAIAVTYGPGLIGSLLIGVETVKTLAFAFDKPVIPVNHLLAHIFANFIDTNMSLREIEDDEAISKPTANPKPLTPSFPFIGLIVSGGHTDLLYFESIEKYTWLGGTRDDAAGEALDKIGRLLNLPYPAGPEIEKRAKSIQNSKNNIKFHSPLLASDDFDFSFSGLKAEVSRFVAEKDLTNKLINEICYAVQDAIFKVLIKKTVQACVKYGCSTILLGGGVTANKTLLGEFNLTAKSQLPNAKIFAPERQYSTDNAAMIGAYAALNPKTKPWNKIESTPDLYFN